MKSLFSSVHGVPLFVVNFEKNGATDFFFNMNYTITFYDYTYKDYTKYVSTTLKITTFNFYEKFFLGIKLQTRGYL